MQVISVYVTKSGIEAMRIKQYITSNGKVCYSWIGSYGAGSGHNFEYMLKIVNLHKLTKRGMRLESGIEFENVKEPSQ